MPHTTTSSGAHNLATQDARGLRINTRTGFGVISKAVMTGPVSANGKVLYALLASYAQYGNRECWVRRRVLADDLGWSVDTLDRTMRELVAGRVVERQYRYAEDGGQRSSIFRLLDFVAIYGEDTG